MIDYAYSGNKIRLVTRPYLNSALIKQMDDEERFIHLFYLHRDLRVINPYSIYRLVEVTWSHVHEDLIYTIYLYPYS